MKACLLAILLVVLAANAGEPTRARPNAAGFPTKAGEYAHKQWKYVYEIQNEGTRSEVRIGKLFLEGKEVLGEPGELLEELFGHFIYFGERGWNRGWLNTLTYNRPVFDAEGNPTEEARSLLPKEIKGKTEPQRGANPPPPAAPEGGSR